MSYPPGMCTEPKPSAAEAEPSEIGTEEPFGGFLISLWFELRDLRSLDPQVDNISRQSRGTVQQWKGTAHLHATGALPKSFSMSKNVTTPLVAITALRLGHLLRPLASKRCQSLLSLHPFRPRWPSLSSHYTSVDYPRISLYQYIPVGLTQFEKARGFNRQAGAGVSCFQQVASMFYFCEHEP